MKKLSVIIVLSWIILGIAACSTTKKKSVENVKGLKKSMHNLNARFNGYHNAKIILKESFTNLSGQHQDNYNQILPLFREAAVEDAQSSAGQLDEAIKKSSIVISLHRPSKWTDDAYLLIGQAQYLKQNYEEANETFDYIIKEYSPENIYEKKRAALKKSKNKKKRSAASRKLKPEALEEELAKKKYHRTAWREALIWRARTLVEVGDFENAQFLIKKMEKDEKFSKKQLAQVAAVNSYYHLKQGDYAKSIEPLNQAVEMTKNKRQKTRYTYILAQIYQLDGKQAEAAKAYKQVLSLRPTYDMEFRTRLNMITNEWASNKSDAKSTLNALKRMSKDIKNEEFRDQVYFAMAEVAIVEKQMPEAIEYLKNSVAYNATNRPQKAESYLKLAQIYFGQEEYVFSKRYYDSTLLVLQTNDPRYEEVSEYTSSLTDVAVQIETLMLNDSLVMISKMNDEDRLALAKKLKKDKLEEQGKDPVATTPTRTSAIALPSASGGVKSNFFAYDPVSVKRGMREFQKIWGDRPLDDNWRRSGQGSDAVAGIEEVVDDFAKITVSDAEMKTFFKDVPDSPGDFEKIDKENIEALFLLGNLFRDRLGKEDKAIETFEDLLARYPDNKHDLEAMYSLYVLYKDKGDRKAETYKKKILAKYPDSKHAKVIKNPGAMASMEDAGQRLDKYYSSTFALYEDGEFEQALTRIGKVEEEFGDANTMQPKFALLMALCTGNVNGKDAYVQALTEVIQKHTGTEEARKAQEFLSYIGASAATTGTKPDAGQPKGKKDLFVSKPDDQHYIVVVLDKKNVKLDKLKEAISDYHKEFHKLENLKISSLMLNLESSVLIVRRFADEKTAQKYWTEVKGKKDKYLKGLDPEAQIFPLSQSNYKTLLRIRDIKPYLAYCQENYN